MLLVCPGTFRLKAGVFHLPGAIMIQRIVVALLLAGGAAMSPSASAQSAPPLSLQDTTKVFPLPEVVTTASRIDLLHRATPGAITLLTREDMDLGVGTLLADHLAAVPGLFVRPYGGGSALQTLSLRGMAPENTLVLVDGQKINNPQNGQADFGFLSGANIERIEIARGGYSSLYGADAVGGVVNIVMRKPPDEVGGSFAQTIGSSGFQATEGAFRGRGGALGWQMNLRSERGSGDYAYFFQDTELHRNGNDFQLLTLNGSAELALGGGDRLFLSSTLADGNRGVASPVSDASVTSRARLGDRTFRAIAGSEFSTSHEILAKISGALYADDQHYIDPHLLLNGAPMQSDGKTRAVTISPELRYSGIEGMPLLLGGEIGKSWFTGTDLRAGSRNQWSAFLTAVATLETGALPFEILLLPSLRYDGFSDVEGGLSPRLGVNIGLWKEPSLRIRSSVGKSYRVPTFNDLYWTAGGNPALKPERSFSVDAGVLAEAEWHGRWSLDASYFSIRTSDRIIWTPTTGTYWSPKNIADVSSRGFEVEATWKGFEGILDVTLASTWTTATKTSEDFPGDLTKDKELVYVPRQTASATAGLHLAKLHLSVQHAWTSYRYTTETNDRFLPSFGVTSAALKYAFPMGPVEGFVKLESSNLFDTKYQVLSLYPMPLREMRLTVGAGI
jgi:vitamin B12 transporter